MRTRIAAAAVLVLAASDAHAVVRYLVQNMSCAEIQQSLQRDKVAILYRQGKSGISLYDRFVESSNFCKVGETTAVERVAVADTQACRVQKCVVAERFGRD